MSGCAIQVDAETEAPRCAVRSDLKQQPRSGRLAFVDDRLRGTLAVTAWAAARRMLGAQHHGGDRVYCSTLDDCWTAGFGNVSPAVTVDGQAHPPDACPIPAGEQFLD